MCSIFQDSLVSAFTRCLYLGILVGCSLLGANISAASDEISCEALYSETPIQVDGLLDEEIWKDCPGYSLCLTRDNTNSATIQEPGNVRFAWDDHYFYLAASFKDTDIVAEGETDQLHHYQFGDVCELFLKPEDQSWYWELYVTPHGKKTNFWFPSRGRLGLPSCFEETGSEMKVAAKRHGSLNDWNDLDESWVAEMAIPIKELTARHESFKPGAKWRICVGRYNFSKQLSNRELSTFPQLPRTDFHAYEDYAKLLILDKNEPISEE